MDIRNRLCGKWESINEFTGRKIGYIKFDNMGCVETRMYRKCMINYSAEGFYYILNEREVIMFLGLVCVTAEFSISGNRLTIGKRKYEQNEYIKCPDDASCEKVDWYAYCCCFVTVVIIMAIAILLIYRLHLVL